MRRDTGEGDALERYCIVGAGPGGLAAARALRALGVPFDVLERQDDVGGIWNGDASQTPMYESAHFISSSRMSGFDGYPMPASYPDYPSWRLVREYLRAFARDNDLYRHIRFGAEVVDARHDGEAWRVALDTGETRRYRGLVVATGHHWTPRLPSYPGSFSGTAYHAFQYRTAESLRGKRVLVVGGGNSGCDIACDAAGVASRTLLSVRRGYHVLPKHIFGKPTDAFFRSGPEPPLWLAQPLLTALLRLVVGDLTRVGMPKPDHRVLESHPIVSSQLVHHLTHGDLTVTPDVRELDGTRVRFADGSAEEVDVIIWATGYEVDHPFLGPGSLPREAPADVLFAHVVHRVLPELYVMGLFETDGGAYPLLSQQAELVAAAIAARAAGGARQRRLASLTRQARPDFSGGVRHLRTPRHAFYVQYESYRRYLRRTLRDLGRERTGALR